MGGSLSFTNGSACAPLTHTHITAPRSRIASKSSVLYGKQKTKTKNKCRKRQRLRASILSHTHIRISPPSSPLSPSSQACYGRQCLRQYFFFSSPTSRIYAYSRCYASYGTAKLSLTRRQGKRATSICVSQYWYFCAQVKASESSTSSRLSAAKVKRATSY